MAKSDSTKSRTRRSSKKEELQAAQSRAYPFPTKAQIAERIANEGAYAVACVQQLHALGAPMCSHVKAFETVVAQIVESKNPAKSRNIVAECRRLAVRYTRRLAVETRREMLEKDPSLAELAELFSAKAA